MLVIFFYVLLHIVLNTRIINEFGKGSYSIVQNVCIERALPSAAQRKHAHTIYYIGTGSYIDIYRKFAEMKIDMVVKIDSSLKLTKIMFFLIVFFTTHTIYK